MESATQEEIFKDTEDLIQSAVDGFNVCIFATGTSRSGKSFTLLGDPAGEFEGIVPRACNRIFELEEKLRSKFTISVSVYMIDIYYGKLVDLLSMTSGQDRKQLKVKKDENGMVFIEGIEMVNVQDAEGLFTLIYAGKQNRYSFSTMMNSVSYSGHLIIGIMIESTCKETGQVLKGKLSIVDLASRYPMQHVTDGTQNLVREMMLINSSLAALDEVVVALAKGTFVPYRNNVLTHLLQDCLGGNAKTLLFTNISPSDFEQEDTIRALLFASKFKMITREVSKNVVIKKEEEKKDGRKEKETKKEEKEKEKKEDEEKKEDRMEDETKTEEEKEKGKEKEEEGEKELEEKNKEGSEEKENVKNTE
ncbi:uncharacterized protein [Argopecten irradians]